MEFDSQSQCSDEGVDLPLSENGDIYPGDYQYLEENPKTCLEAKFVYLLLPKNVPISRAARLQWLLDHLNTIIIIPTIQKVNETTTDLEIISAVPREQHMVRTNRFLVTYRTEVKFLAHSYRFVYCLDMSPSQSTVDIQKGEILFDEILNCFKASVEGLSKQFTIPGNSLVFQPCIYLTVMVNTPFFISPAQQVIIKGIQLTQKNLNYVVSYVKSAFYLLEEKIADVAAMAHEYTDHQNCDNVRNLGTSLCTFREPEQKTSKIPMVTPDANFVNMLRYSMLAISLLPENSISHILVITDGIVAMPDSNIMESLLFQLHFDSISVSFLKVGSTFHPHSSAGYVSYIDLLYFFAHSTLGTCLERFPEVVHEPSISLNVYHELFLIWSFHTYQYPYLKASETNKWTTSNETFCHHKPTSMLSKRQTEENTSASIILLLTRRMREGFTVDSIFYINGNLEVKLSLQWKTFIYIYYKVSSPWPTTKNNSRYEISITASYEFLHDITCMMKKDAKSLYRQAIIDRFWLRLSQLSSVELDQQLSSFQQTKDWYTLPESVRSGIPVFILNSLGYSDSNKLSLTPRDTSCPKFVNLWQSISQMETNSWRKWLHTHKVSVILKHDHPLPKHLHLAKSSQRFQVVQCRQAAAALYGMLADWSSFVLIDNHTYLKFLYKEPDKPPVWFCIIRVSSKLPCAVLNIGFTTGTPGSLRQQIYDELKMELSTLTYLSSPIKSKENICCMLLQKPFEKILIRYERIPNNFMTVIFPDGTQPPHCNLSMPSPIVGSLFTTLSRYLFHKRWIWSASHSMDNRLPDNAVSRILSTLTRMRMKEGFNFAHSSSGVITMVLELWMDPLSTCVVQYVLFPPHHAWKYDELFSGSEDDTEALSDYEEELQIVTEVWIEPQNGRVVANTNRLSYMNNKHYYELADVISKIDLHCINSLLTMEHLSLMCQDKDAQNMISLNRLSSNTSRRSFTFRTNKSRFDSPKVPEKGSQWFPILTPRIEHIPFTFDPINILPLCQQTELLFSMFIEGKDRLLYLKETNYCENPNVLLLENIQEHLSLVHDKEIDLSRVESDTFTQQILLRHKNKHPHLCPVSEYENDDKVYSNGHEELLQSKWRCYLKGISVTHVILTFIPSTLDNLKELVTTDQTIIPSLNDSIDSSDRISSRCSNYSDVPINIPKSVCLPIYVFDCPLAMIVNAYINNTEKCSPTNDDVYEDHRFKNTVYIQEDCIRLKSDEIHPSPEPKSEESESPEHNNAKQHCKTVVLAYSKCFTSSLFIALHRGVFVHSHDVQAAIDQCEESVSEIDITEYIMAVCGHMNHLKGDAKVNVQKLGNDFSCNELKNLHMIIKEKFLKMVDVSFSPIPTNQEFYFYRSLANIKNNKAECTINDSDDEIYQSGSETGDAKSDDDSNNFFFEEPCLQRLQSSITDVISGVISPLFLHLICTIKYNTGKFSNTSVRVLPTCLGELVQNLEPAIEFIDKSKIQVTLDMLCLTLPNDMQNIITDYSKQGLRTTSFCSDGLQSSVGSAVSANSFISDIPEPLNSLPESQRNSIISLRDEIKWLLKDEICTALLDVDEVTSNILKFVIKHVSDSSPRSSCILEKIDLNFVYASAQSHEKFVQEFTKIKLKHYRLCRVDEMYYLAKDLDTNTLIIDCIRKTNNCLLNCREANFSQSPEASLVVSTASYNSNQVNGHDNAIHDVEMKGGDKYVENEYKEDASSQQSDISSSSVMDTDGGYEEDVSEGSEDYDWLVHLSNKRPHLPNFWLIMQVEPGNVSVYFHCRFLELLTIHVGGYLEVQRKICETIRSLCKRVNQLLLLQSLYELKLCDALLEPDDSCKDWHADLCTNKLSKNISYCRLENPEESNDDLEMANSASLSDASLNFKSGYFSCPVVWETHFILHPRLKTGPGKSGISRGILALKHILEKFSISNRNNMFVYRDCESNVFYLRLHENVQYSGGKITPLRSNEYESGLMSRSPSIASLPLGQNKNNLTQSEQSISSALSSDIRPRVRSFGEKGSKDVSSEDTLILKVHGITEAGTDVQFDLIQVLQNRLDDAVLEFLSVMLARNAMCPLTPEDVHFIQKPFSQPELCIGLTIQDFAVQVLDTFVHYLKQNLLQFLNVPKYTDNRRHYHFKDYCEIEEIQNSPAEDNIFIYNQSQNPSSGNRGIACIALAIVQKDATKTSINFEDYFKNILTTKNYDPITQTSIIHRTDEKLPDCYLEFRLWKQGRVNIDNLSQKLKAAVSQAIWDIVIEYYILRKPLCQEFIKTTLTPRRLSFRIDSLDVDLSKEMEFQTVLDLDNKSNIKESVFESKKLKVLTHPFRKYNRHVIQPSLKLMKSITFDNDDGKEREKNKYKTGDNGMLCEAYAKFLPDWLEFGFLINVPSVRKQKILLTNRHTPNVIVKELLNMLADSPKAFRELPSYTFNNNPGGNIYVAHNTSNSNESARKYIIIARNFDYWALANNNEAGISELPELMSPHTLKHGQKFVPIVVNNQYIPRQKILWISVECDNIVIYNYNWTKDSLDKLINNCSNLGQWLCVRSCFLSSATSQKLGLFHNQSLTQKCFITANNPYTNYIGNLDCMTEFPRESSRKRIQASHHFSSTLEVFRDSFHNLKHTASDPVVIYTIEMNEIKSMEKRSRDEMKKLHAMYQSRTSSTTVPQIYLLMQNSRILHYCHTPLLFLPRWRLQSAATRDHSLFPYSAANLEDKVANEEKEQWHTELCYGFFSGYRNYLQTLGFIPLQIDISQKKAGLWNKDKCSFNSVFYIQKTILGGILLFTMEFSEPFFVTKLHAIECNRLQTINSRASINRFTLSFLDEFDRVKILMHLHSFTYDYHLRCIYNYIANVTGVNRVSDRYNVHQFLDDFMKYYTKAPNFARNLVHTDTLTISDLVTEGKQLYDYLLANISHYNFKVLEVDSDGEVDYILVQVTTTSQVSYKDSQDIRHTDDFDVTLVVYNLCTPYNPTDNTLHLKYYLLLTSKKEIYPKTEVEHKLGKFRTVSSATRSSSVIEKSEKENELEISVTNTVTSEGDCDEPNEDTFFPELPANLDSTSLPHIEISQESVNYLGYYSTHEQLMQQIILDKANTTQKYLKEMVAKGMVHCRTHLLWNRLIVPQETNSLTYDEFMELKALAKLEHLCDFQANLGPLLNQSLSWYQGLAKLLLMKYTEQSRTFVSPDGNIQHYVILHPRYFGAFMLLSIDLHTSRGDIYAVYREPHLQEDAERCLAYQKSLLDGFVNCICFYLWSGMISN